MVCGKNETVGRLLKPAVRGVTAAKNEVATFPPVVKCFKELLYSKNKKRMVPATNNMRVKVITVRVVVLTILTCDGIRREEPVSL